MNNYPTWWNQTLTIFNKSEDTTTRKITWYKTVVSNCFWKNTVSQVRLGETTIYGDSIICRIPSNSNYESKFTWEMSDDKSDTFTLAPDDIIILGEVEDTINEYVDGQRSSDILKKYRKQEGCMQIRTVTVNVGGGRGNEHYFVRGT